MAETPLQIKKEKMGEAGNKRGIVKNLIEF
jgi:hypothetical protein